MSTMTLPLAGFRTRATSLLRDYAELGKLRVTSLIVMTAWCGYFFGAHQAGVSWISWGLFHSLLGIGLVSSGTAALNEVMEHDVDAHMRRTALRPLPAGRMSLFHATAVGLLAAVGGSIYLAVFTNPLTGLLTILTSVVYLAAYTPLKRISPICTFVGAFPGAMPGVLGWTAARGKLEWGTLVLFAILFVWQFPHFFSIAWLYREDYANGGVKMLPVVEQDGRSTARRILVYSIALIPISLLPSFMGMAGKIYLVGAAILGFALLYFGIRLAFLNLPLTSALSKTRARHVLQATVIYLPLLFALMMTNSLKP
jgi:heme o synthase